MTDFFLPDLLSEACLLENVLGLPGFAKTEVRLSGGRFLVSEQTGRVSLMPDANRETKGYCVSLDDDGANRLRYWAGTHGWEEREVEVVDTSGKLTEARAFFGDTSSDDQWSDDTTTWAKTWLPIWSEASEEILSYKGELSTQQVASRLPVIWTRAHARRLAGQSTRTAESGLTRENVQLNARTRPYSNFFAVEEFLLTHERFDGSHTPEILRAVFVGSDAVTVLPYDPVRDRVLLVEQFRAGPFGRGDRSPWLLEVVAGRIEPGDTPEETARKEASEEAGLTLGRLHPIAQYYPSTGGMTEFIHAFLGEADLPDDAAQLAGIVDEHEDIKGHVMTREEMMARIVSGGVPDGPLILSAFWLQANLNLFGANH